MDGNGELKVVSKFKKIFFGGGGLRGWVGGGGGGGGVARFGVGGGCKPRIKGIDKCK